MSSQIEPDANSSDSTTTQSASTSTSTSTPTAKAVSIPSKVPPGTCFQQNIVTIEIGTKKKAYSIHKDLLVFYSDYFRAAFNGSFTEATERKITLSLERVDVFDIIAKFIYTRQLSDGMDCDIEWGLLCRVWIFGDKYLMPALQNRAMSTLIGRNNNEKMIPTNCIKLIYKNTVPGSLLRKFIVDRVAYKSDLSSAMSSESCQQWPNEALVELVRALGVKEQDKGIGFELPEDREGNCYYHLHTDDEKC